MVGKLNDLNIIFTLHTYIWYTYLLYFHVCLISNATTLRWCANWNHTVQRCSNAQAGKMNFKFWAWQGSMLFVMCISDLADYWFYICRCFRTASSSIMQQCTSCRDVESSTKYCQQQTQSQANIISGKYHEWQIKSQTYVFSGKY